MGDSLKRFVHSCYSEIRYLFSVLIPHHISLIPKIDDARSILTKASPKPIGHYDNIQNPETDNELDLSIVVPMYNVEQYLEECLLSILSSETQYSYEILCIDDGSPDNSYNIAFRLQQIYGDKKIKIIRQKNRGFSGARNRGIDDARGKYLMFVDSDDRIEKTMIEKLLSTAVQTNHDIVAAGFYTFSDKNSVSKKYLNQAVSCSNHADQIIRQYPTYFWGKVFSRAMWNNIRLPEGYWFEDMCGLYIIPHLTTGFTYIPDPLYGYRQNPAGISATSSKRIKSIDQYWMTEFIQEEYTRLGLKTENWFYRSMLKELSCFLWRRTSGLDDEIRLALFLVSCQQVASWKWDSKSAKLSLSEKRVLAALKSKDFKKWENASKFWH